MGVGKRTVTQKVVRVTSFVRAAALLEKGKAVLKVSHGGREGACPTPHAPRTPSLPTHACTHTHTCVHCRSRAIELCQM